MLIWKHKQTLCSGSRDAYLYSSFTQVNSSREFFSNKGVGIMCPFEHSLQRCQLITIERCSVSSLLSSSFAVLVIFIVILITTCELKK